MAKVADDTTVRSPLRLRPDLHWTECPGALVDRWRVKDPLTLEYHEFGAEERFLLEQFEGRSSLEQIKQRYDEHFAPKTIRLEQLMQFAAEAHARGLLLVDGRSQGTVLAERGNRARRWALGTRLFSLLFFRLPGFDPNRLLEALCPLTRWFWRPATFLTIACAGLVALGMMAARAPEFAARLPSSQEFLQAGNLTLLLLAFIAVKCVHELAHGLACRHVGARCHEMGVVLIALVPCLYCDVTDLWMVADRWKRMLVSAAGMYAELAIGVLCCFLWMFASEGVVAAILLNLIIACTVSTLIFNANPLLKLDGYFLLSDWAGVSNLHQRSQRALFEPTARWFRHARRPQTPVRFDWPLALYAALSLVYRGIVIVLLLWAAHQFLASLGLKPVGDVLVAISVVGLVVAPAYRLATTLRSPLLRRAVRWGRVAGASAAGVAALSLLLALPAPRTITAPAVFEVQDARTVNAVVEGALMWSVVEGAEVEAGQELARLENPDLVRRRTKLQGEVNRLETRLESLRNRATFEPALLVQEPAAEASVRRAKDELRKLDEEIERLTLRAPCPGVVIAASRQANQKNPTGRLETWEGHLLDPENRGCWVRSGDVVCLVAPDPSAVRATVMIDHSDTSGVRSGLPARVLAFQSCRKPLRAEIDEVARAEFDHLKETLRRHPDLLLSERGPGAAVLQPVLLATIDLSPEELPVRHASHGRCKIEAGGEPIGRTAWRWLAQTFPFSL